MQRKNPRAEAVLAARRLLGLQSSATLMQIKTHYRDLARESHPDLHPAEEQDHWEARMKELNAAYELLMDYCNRYAFSFDRAVVERQCRKQDPAEYWREQFFDM